MFVANNTINNKWRYLYHEKKNKGQFFIYYFEMSEVAVG